MSSVLVLRDGLDSRMNLAQISLVVIGLLVVFLFISVDVPNIKIANIEFAHFNQTYIEQKKRRFFGEILHSNAQVRVRADGSIRIRVSTSSLFDECLNNFSKHRCDGDALKVLAPATERRSYFFSEKYVGLPNSYTNFFYAMHSFDGGSCQNFDFEDFDDWFSQDLSPHGSPDMVVLRTVPSRFDHCFEGSHIYPDKRTRVFWMQSGLEVRGDIFCRRKNDVLNPICRVEIFCENGSWISSVSPLPAINASKLPNNIFNIFSEFSAHQSWRQKCDLFQIKTTPAAVEALQEVTKELSSE